MLPVISIFFLYAFRNSLIWAGKKTTFFLFFSIYTLNFIHTKEEAK